MKNELSISNFSSSHPIIIIGAGPVGITLAILLKQLGLKTLVFEARPKNHFLNSNDNRSVNITLSQRGLSALELIGCADKIKKQSAKVKGRTYHMCENGFFVPYTLRENYCLYSIKRNHLEQTLVEQAEEHEIEIFFNHRLSGINCNSKLCTFSVENEKTEVKYGFLFGADGVNSAVRTLLNIESLTSTNPFVYKKIEISKENANRLKLNDFSVNIWKDSKGMLLSLPNLDGSHSGLLHLKNLTLDSVYDDNKLVHEFFPSLIRIIDGFEDKFFQSSDGAFKNITCNNWFLRKNILLMGDAAHAMVPFYGQGTNCGLEDAVFFCNLINDCNGDLNNTAHLFEQLRQKDTDAISHLSLQNLKNLEVEIDFGHFITIKSLELALEKRYFDFNSEYFSVAFSEIPFGEALKKSLLYKPVLEKYTELAVLKGQTEFSTQVLDEIYSRINKVFLN